MVYANPLLHYGRTAVKIALDVDTAAILDLLLTKHDTSIVITKTNNNGYELMVIGEPLSIAESRRIEEEILNEMDQQNQQGLYSINLWELDEDLSELEEQEELED